MEWLSSSMLFRAAGQETTNMSWTGSADRWRCVHAPLTVLRQRVAGRHAVRVGDHHGVLAQVVFIGAGEGQPGAEGQRSELRDTSSLVGSWRGHAPQTAYVLPLAVTDTRGQSPIGL